MTDLLQELRDATAPRHRELDALARRLDPASGPDAYREYLLRFHQGLAATWMMVNWGKLVEMGLPDAESRLERYAELGRDLVTLGHPVPGLEWRREATAATATGSIYVLEGSIHGGKILLTALRDRGIPLPPGSTGFLEGFGKENGRMWTEFTSWLRNLAAPAAFAEEACESAIRAFDHFVTTFSPDPCPDTRPK